MVASVLVMFIVMSMPFTPSSCRLNVIQERKAAAAKRRGAGGSATPGLPGGEAGVFENCDSDIACAIRIGVCPSIELCVCVCVLRLKDVSQEFYQCSVH